MRRLLASTKEEGEKWEKKRVREKGREMRKEKGRKGKNLRTWK